MIQDIADALVQSWNTFATAFVLFVPRLAAATIIFAGGLVVAILARRFVQRLLEAPPVATRLSKRLVMDGLNRSYRDHVLAQEYASLANRSLADNDISEGVAAFKDKRSPKFQGSQKKPRWENY